MDGAGITFFVGLVGGLIIGWFIFGPGNKKKKANVPDETEDEGDRTPY